MVWTMATSLSAVSPVIFRSPFRTETATLPAISWRDSRVWKVSLRFVRFELCLAAYMIEPFRGLLLTVESFGTPDHSLLQPLNRWRGCPVTSGWKHRTNSPQHTEDA